MRRLLPLAAGALVLVAGLYGLMSLFSGRDRGGIAQEAGSGPGQLEPLRDGPPEARGDPPTSGEHEARNVTREGRLTPEELLTALEQGNVVLAYPAARPPAGLRRVQEEVSGPFDPELAAAGQMVVLTHWPGIDGVQALAHRRRLRAGGPEDPRVRAFAEAWLGKGRGNTG